MRNQHLAEYSPINGKIIKLEGRRYRLKVHVVKAIYPYPHDVVFASATDIEDDAGPYCVRDLADYDTHDQFQPALLNALRKLGI